MALLRVTTPAATWPRRVAASRPSFRRPVWVTSAVATMSQPVDPLRASIAVLLISGLGLASTAFVPEAAAREQTTAEATAEAIFVGVFSIGCLVTWMGCVTGRRWGLFAALPVSIFMLISALACPLSGHHTFGAWVFGASGAALGAVLLNIAALRMVGPPR